MNNTGLSGAVIPLVNVQARHSSGPTVKKVFKSNKAYVSLISLSKPLSLIPKSSMKIALSSASKAANSLSILAQIGTTSHPSFAAYSFKVI